MFRIPKILPALLLVTSLIAACRSANSSTEIGDPTGTWVGDFGPAFYDRNTISLELHWDGHTLTGMVRPGSPGGRMYRNFAGFPIQNASFEPQTGMLKFEATYQARHRHYFIAGRVGKTILSGTWNRPDDRADGDFKLTKKT